MRDAEQTVAHRAAGHAGFEINVVRRGRVNGAVMRTPSGLDGGCANWGWMLVVSAGPFEASRSKGAVSGTAAFRRGKTLARSVQFL